MADESRVESQEGWDAPARPALIAMAAITFVLLVAVSAGIHVYRRTIEPKTMVTLPPLPLPRLETIRTAPGERRPDRTEPPPTGIAAAMAATAAEGDALWNSERP